MKRGRFIVFDGGEGSGKGSVLKRLREIYPNDVIFTREPGGTPFAEEIRSKWLLSERGKTFSPLAHFIFFWVARAHHVLTLIEPALASGKHVISDRYDSSTWAYQICAQGHGDLAEVFWQMKEALSVMPDLYIYLDVDPHEGLRRAKERGELNHFDGRDINFHSAVRSGFLQFIGKMKDLGIPTLVIDANPPRDEVVEKAVAAVAEALA